MRQNPNSSPDSLIIGKWFVNQVFIDGIEYPVSDCEKLSERIFNSNGKFWFTFHGDISDTECLNDGDEGGNWEMNGEILKLIWDFFDSESPQIVEWDIIELTSTTFKLGRQIIISNEYYTTVYIR